MSSEPRPSPDRRKRQASRQFVLVGTLAECGLGLIALFLAWLFGIPLRDQFQWNLADVGKGVLATIPMLCVLVLVEFAPGRSFQRLRAIVDLLIGPLIRSVSPAELALLSLAAGLGEEVFFRGFIQGGLQQLFPDHGLALAMPWEGPALAIVIGGIFFGLAHPLSPSYIVLTMLLGIYLGVLFYGTGNLLIPIVAHTAYDFIALVYLAYVRRLRLGQGH